MLTTHIPYVRLLSDCSLHTFNEMSDLIAIDDIRKGEFENCCRKAIINCNANFQKIKLRKYEVGLVFTGPNSPNFSPNCMNLKYCQTYTLYWSTSTIHRKHIMPRLITHLFVYYYKKNFIAESHEKNINIENIIQK